MKRIICMLLTLALTLGCVGASAETVKHERVYVVVNAAGDVQSLTDSVRLENGDALPEIADRTLLTAIQNVGGHEAFTLDGETLTWQAQGRDITYQGTSDQAPAVLPTVTLTLDGEPVTAQELADQTGHATLRVDYQAAQGAPLLAVTVLPLPETGVDDLSCQNAMVFTEAGRRILIGWGVPGAGEALGLPAAFTAEFTADHADLSWMMTLATAGPVDAVMQKAAARIGLEPQETVDQLTTVLTAAMAGKPLPEEGPAALILRQVNSLMTGVGALNQSAGQLAAGAGQVSEGAATLNEAMAQLNGGAAQLRDGAQTLAGGAASASSGAAQLTTGLTALTANNDALNQGAEAIFNALLSTAAEQLSAAGLDVPALTIENYAEVMDALLAQLDPEAVKAQAAAQVEEAVRAQVNANADQVRAAVEQAVQAKVLKGVLTAANVPMTAEQYAAAQAAGKVSPAQAQAVEAAVQEQMASEAVRAQVEQAVAQQIEELVQQNVAEQMAGETVTEKLAQAEQGRARILALKEQLNQVSAFVSGLAQYTGGVSQAAAGAQSLQEGLTQLNEGAATLHTGAATLAEGMTQAAAGAATLAEGTAQVHTGAAQLQSQGTQSLVNTLSAAEKLAAARLLPLAKNQLSAAVNAYADAIAQVGAGYDLRADGMDGETVYIIRTDLRR